jgi:hypothetical protein
VLGTTALWTKKLFPVFWLHNSSPPARISQSYCDFFRFALLPTDAKLQRSNRINQKKENHSQTNKENDVSVIPSHFMHSIPGFASVN